MRKILLTVLALTVFTACSSDDRFKDEADFESLTGILKEQKVVDEEAGTHLLAQKDGEEVPVRSISLNLSDPKYLDNEVDLLGVYSDDDVFEVTSITVLEVLSKAKISGKLVEYMNSDFGVKVKYYDDWKLNVSDDAISFTSSDAKAKFSIVTVPFTAKTAEPLKEYYESIYGKEQYKAELMKKIGVDGLDAIEMDFAEQELNYFLYRDGLIYSLILRAESKADFEDNVTILKEILNSFQFVGFTVDGGNVEEDAGGEEAPAATEKLVDLEPKVIDDFDLKGFAQFESLPYSFRGKYPADWYYAGAKGSNEGVLHHYGFAEDSVTADNELIGLDVLNKKPENDSTLSGKMVVYSEVGDKVFRVFGPQEYNDLIVLMAGSIERIEKTD